MRALRKKDASAAAVRALQRRQERRTEFGLILPLHAANALAELLVPCWVVHATDAEALPSSFLITFTVVVFLKLWSYAHANHDLRCARRWGQFRPGERGSGEALEGIAHPVAYPENITPGNLGYFLAAPTLCYQVAYPRSSRFRGRWLLRCALFACAEVRAPPCHLCPCPPCPASH